MVVGVGGVEFVDDRVEVAFVRGESEGVVDRLRQAGVRGDDREAGAQAVVDVVGAGGRVRDGGRDEHRRVDAVRGVGEGGVAVGLFGRGGRVAGVGPAVDVGADQGADPFAERVAVAGGVRGVDAGEEVAVGDAFGGEGAACGEFVEPEPCHVRGGEVAAVAGEQEEVEEGVVEIVVLGHAVDVLGEGGGSRTAVPGVGGEELRGDTTGGEPGGEGPVAGCPGELADRGEGEFLDGFAEEAADGAAEPGGLQPSRVRGRGGEGVAGLRLQGAACAHPCRPGGTTARRVNGVGGVAGTGRPGRTGGLGRTHRPVRAQRLDPAQLGRLVFRQAAG